MRAELAKTQAMAQGFNQSFETGQLRAASAVDTYTKKLEKQKVTFRDMMHEGGRLRRAAYQEQLKLQNITAKALPGVDQYGRRMYQYSIPTQVNASWDTFSNRIGWTAENLRSASIQMQNWGKNTQWAGRQMMVGFTMPLVAAGAAAGVMAYQVDKELTRIAKVYDTQTQIMNGTAEEFAAREVELNQVRAASWETAKKATDEYGVAAVDTLNIQAELAAMGKTGADLQKSTIEIMRIATLGEMEYADALNASVAMQSVFNQSADEVVESFNYMNAVENATSLQLKDFAAAIPIAAAPVKEFGGDIQELGTLLVAMRENGIQATEGANAIKAAMQRLGRPSKQIQEEFQAITGKSIVELVDGSESLIEVFSRINEVTKDLSGDERRDVFAGLFGSYQVTRMIAMTKGMDDLAKGTGQVSDAMRLAQQDSSDWAKAADREIRQLQESAAKRLDIAWNRLKNMAVEFGAPFLEAAVGVLDFLTDIGNAIANAPDFIKSFIKWGAIVVALVGPLGMLAGLVMNMAGFFGRTGAAVLNLFGKMGVLNRETAITQATLKLASGELLTTAEATTITANAMNQLATNANAAASAVGRASAAGLVPGGARQTGKYVPNSQVNTTVVPAGATMLPIVARDVEKSTEKTKGHMRGAAGYAGIMSAAFAASMLSSDQTVDHVSNMVMMFALLAPMVQSLPTAFRALSGMPILTKGFWSGIGSKTAGIFSPATLGITALVSGYALFHKLATDNINDQKEINNSVQNWAEEMGIVLDTAKKINAEQDKYGKTMTLYDRAQAYKKTNPEITDEYLGADPDRQVDILLREYSKALDAGMNKAQINEMLSSLVFLDEGSVEDTTKKIDEINAHILQMGEDFQDKLRAEAIGREIFSMLEDIDSASLVAVRGMADAFNIEFSNMLKLDRVTAMDSVAESFTNNWQNAFDTVRQENSALFDRLGIDSAEKLKGLVADYNAVVRGEMSEEGFMNIWNIDESEAMDVFNALATQLAGINTITGSLSVQEREFVDLLADHFKIEQEIYTIEQLRAALQSKGLMGLSIEEANKAWSDYLRYNYMASDEEQLHYLNLLRVQAGLEETTNLADGFRDMGARTNDEIEKGKRGVDELTRAERMAKMEAKRLKAAWEGIDWSGPAQEVMTNVVGDIADMASQDFDSMMNASLDSYRDSQQGRMDALQAAQERQSNGLQNAQERQTNAFEKQWERRKKAVEDAFDRRIERVQKLIKAEERAEEQRKRIFEAELARIQRMNDIDNATVDFNVALDTGQLDEAAKIRNDIAAQQESWALEDENARAERQHERAMDRLDDQIEKIEELKDKRLEALERIEEKERESLERMQERQQQALENRQEAAQAALEQEVESNIAAQEEIWENRRDKMDEAIAYFQSYTPRNEAELQAHIERTIKKYSGFGFDVEAMFSTTSQQIGDLLFTHTRNAANDLKSQVQWESIGQVAASRMIAGGLGMTWAQFKSWMGTGEWPKGAGDRKPTRVGSSGRYDDVDATPDRTPRTIHRHTGGWADKSAGSRKGVARTTKGLHPSELMIRAQEGEFIVNREAAKRHPKLLENINSGKTPHGDIGGFESPGFAGVMGAAIRGAMYTGIQNAIVERHNDQTDWWRANQAPKLKAGAGWGSYNLPGVKPWVLEAANYLGGKYNIGTILGVGQRSANPTSDHPKGLALDFMTYDRIATGWNLAREAQRLSNALDLTYAIFHGKIWSVARAAEGWRNYQHPSGATDPTSMHMDHVHLSFSPSGDTGDLPGGGGYVPGSGGRHRPVSRIFGLSQGLHDTDTNFPAVDFDTGTGNPIFAAMGGRVTTSKDLTYSYGKHIIIGHGNGSTLYAHLSRRSVGVGQNVAGGAVIGYSGNTGNSTGDHLHFGANGIYDPRNFVGLAKGAANINVEGLYNLHKNEGVLTEDLNRKFKEGVERFANGGDATYNVNVNVYEPGASAEEIVRKTMQAIEFRESRKPRGR